MNRVNIKAMLDIADIFMTLFYLHFQTPLSLFCKREHKGRIGFVSYPESHLFLP